MSALSPATVRLHTMLIRLAKGMLSAWEEWLRESARSPASP